VPENSLLRLFDKPTERVKDASRFDAQRNALSDVAEDQACGAGAGYSGREEPMVGEMVLALLP
jgi:hypothetical protein